MNQLHFENRGRGAGLWTGAFTLGQWLSPLIVTFFSLRMGGFLASLSVMSYAAFAAMAFALFANFTRARPAASHG